MMLTNLLNQLKKMEKTFTEDKEKIQQQIQKIYNEKYNADPIVNQVIKELEESNQFGGNESGIYSWTRFTQAKEYDNIYFKNYLEEQHFFELDVKNEALMSYEAPCIIINNEGDVYDEDNNGIFFLEHSDYSTEEERNKAIAAYMKKTERYPTVISIEDNYGLMKHVNIPA